jgi:uncharacterized membrane protein
MRFFDALRRLVLGETWLLPAGVVAVVLAAALVAKPLLPGAWHHVGGFVLLAGVAGVLVASVSVSARPRR